METIYLCFVIFLFALAVFDLMVGVSNDAVNFLNSAIGAKAARFRTVIIIAAIGVFCGAALSNGMMDIARHGIFRPEQFLFEDLMWIFLGVMITDIVLLDIFNSLGMPTSTTVSMVFELLGGTFMLSIVKLYMKFSKSATFQTILAALRPSITGLIAAAAIVLAVGAEWHGVSLDLSIVRDNFPDWKSWCLFGGALAASLWMKAGPIALLALGAVLGLLLY